MSVACCSKSRDPMPFVMLTASNINNNTQETSSRRVCPNIGLVPLAALDKAHCIAYVWPISSWYVDRT